MLRNALYDLPRLRDMDWGQRIIIFYSLFVIGKVMTSFNEAAGYLAWTTCIIGLLLLENFAPDRPLLRAESRPDEPEFSLAPPGPRRGGSA